MLEALYIASSGAVKQERKLELITNNLANVTTTGYKKDSLFYKEITAPTSDPLTLNEGQSLLEISHENDETSYVAVMGSMTHFSQGYLQPTENPLDLALEGDGFFAMQTEEGIRYSRKGAFRMSDDGQLVHPDGHLVLSEGGDPISIPSGSGQLTVDPDGNISVGSGNNISPVGKIQIAHFADLNNLIKDEHGFFKPIDPDITPDTEGNTKLLQGFVESSNVNVAEEMTLMIETHRLFEAYQKVIQSADEADGLSVSISRVI